MGFSVGSASLPTLKDADPEKGRPRRVADKNSNSAVNGSIFYNKSLTI